MTVLLRLDYLPRVRKIHSMKSRCLLPCLIMAIGVMPTKSQAMSSPDDTIRPYIATNLLYDSNFLRLSDNVDPVLVSGKSDKSDFVKQVTAGFEMDWTLSRQHFIVNANINRNWFQNYTTLDYTGWDTLAQWNWQVGNDLDGDIGYSNAQVLGSFVQLNSLVNNLRNNQRAFASAGYLFHPNGKIKLGFFRIESQLDGTGRQFSNNIEDNAELNLQYLSPTGSIFGLRVLGTSGEFPDRELTTDDLLDNAYTRMNYYITWDWHASVKTRVTGQVGYTQQRYEHFGSRDFSDIVAALDLNWQANDTTLLELSARREIVQADTLFSSFMLTEGIWLNLSWQATPKIALRLPVSYQEQQYLGGGVGVGLDQQKDQVGNVGLSLMYYPVESISIGPVLNYEKRDSNNPFRAYETESAGINLQVAF
jgi:exopolysaccharide biosynthesis operon protein EpsL